MRAAKIDAPKYLGSLCKRGHDHLNTGQSLRKRCDRSCVVCCREKSLMAYRKNPSVYMATRNPDAARAYQAKWRKAERLANPEKVRERGRQRYQRENLVTRLRNRLRKALTAYSANGKTTKSSEYADFMAILNHIGPCPGNLSEWEIDHIKPLCKFDFSIKEQVMAAFHPLNHQWLTTEQNRRKHAKEL